MLSHPQRLFGLKRYWGALLAAVLLVGLVPGAVLAVAPAPPSVPNLAAGSDTGNSNTDNVTQTLIGLVFSGTAEASSTVKVYVGGSTLIGQGLTSAGGNWQVTTDTAIPDNADNLITATATNASAEVSNQSAPLTVTTDNTGPSAPGTPNLDAASDTGTSSTDNITADTTPTFSGTSEPNATIQLLAEGTAVGSGVANGSGNWSVTSSLLSPATYSFTAKQTDAAGNGPSVESSGLSVEINTTVPSTPSAPDLDPGSDSGPLDTDNITNDTTPTFTGTGPGSTAIDLYAGAVVVGTTTSSAGGAWTITSSALSAGTYSVTAKATNVNGTSPASAALSVTIYTSLAVTINQQTNPDQPDPTATSPINFRVAFSNPVGNFSGSDVTISGTAGGVKSATVSGGPTIYNVAVTGMTTTGTVVATIAAGVASDAAGNLNTIATFTDNSVQWNPGAASVTIDQAAGQADPTATSPINFTVVFSTTVTGFVTGDVTITGTAGGSKTATVTPSGSGTVFNVAVTGMTTAGTVIATIGPGVALSSGQPNLASTSTDNTVTWSPGSPTVTINQAFGQADPTATSPINFTVVFSAAVTGFATGEVTISGTAGGSKTATVTGSGTTYNVAVTGMTSSGTVIATVPANVAINASSQANLASTSTDNTVQWNEITASITLTTSAPTPPGAHNPVILWGQGFTLGVQFATNGAAKQVQIQAQRDGVNWNTIATLTTDASGHASMFYTPVTNLYYRAVFAGTPDLGAGTSNQVRTVVRELALLRPTNNGATRTVNRNTSITFTTTVRPARPELAPATVSFYFYRLTSGSYHLITTRNVLIDAAGLAKTIFKFTTSGQWYVRSQANPTAYNANSVMTLEKYSVR